MISALLGWVAWPVVALAYVLPGSLLILDEEWDRAELIELFAIASVGSLAWWSIGIWFIGYVGLPLSAFALASLLVAAVVLVTRRRRTILSAALVWRRAPRPALLGLAFIAAILALRFLIGFTRLAFSVGDMSAHAYMAELIVMQDGLPGTYEPFLPIGDFGSFPPGLHTFAAIETLLGGAPTYRAIMHAQSFALASATLTLVALLRGLGVGVVGSALGAAGALLIGRNPQLIQQWGGAPTLGACAIAFLVLRDALRLTQPCSPAFLLRLGALSAATLLVHQLPVVSFLYIFTALSVVPVLTDRTAAWRLVRSGVVVGIVAVVLSLPFFFRAQLSVPAGVAAWARDWFRHELGPAFSRQTSLIGGLGADGGPSVLTWPFYLLTYLGLLPTALLAAGIALGWRRRPDRRTVIATTLVATHFLMIAGAMAEALPLWPALYPTRVGIWLAPALALALVEIGSNVARVVPRRGLIMAGFAWLVLFVLQGIRLSETRFGSGYYEAGTSGRVSPLAIVANEAVGGAFWVPTFSRDNAVLTHDDLRAFEWIRANTSADAIFANNYGDGGGLIPAIAHRAVSEPHFNLAFYYARELEQLRARPPQYIYVASEESPWHPRRFTAAALDADSSVALVFRAGEARLYRTTRR